MSEKQELLTTKQAASILGIGKSTLDQDRLYGRLRIPYVHVGTRSIRYRRTDLDDYIKSLKA